MDIGVLVILGLAVWRLTNVIVKEEGPFAIFSRLRAYLAQRRKIPGGLYDMVSCFYCLSVWVAMVPALIICNGFVTFVIGTLMISAVSIITYELINK